MHKSFILGVVFAIITGAALASERGRDAYRKCKACHSVIAPDGDFIV
jgi:cytochrome c2